MTDGTNDRLTIVGICGRARAGKDTLANLLTAHHGFHRIALADGIREAFHGLAGPTGGLYKDLDAEFTYRRALQTFGTEARQAVGAHEHWVDHLMIKVAYLAEIHPKPVHRFVVPDIRYRFEAAILHDWAGARGGQFILARVVRPSLSGTTGGLSAAEAAHSSEAESADLPADVEIVNDGTIGDLAGRMATIKELML